MFIQLPYRPEICFSQVIMSEPWWWFLVDKGILKVHLEKALASIFLIITRTRKIPFLNPLVVLLLFCFFHDVKWAKSKPLFDFLKNDLNTYFSGIKMQYSKSSNYNSNLLSIVGLDCGVSVCVHLTFFCICLLFNFYFECICFYWPEHRFQLEQAFKVKLLRWWNLLFVRDLIDYLLHFKSQTYSNWTHHSYTILCIKWI